MIEILADTREAAHEAATQAYAEARRVIETGKRAVIKAGELEEDRSLQQNRHYWGVVLRALADTPVNGSKYSAESWHIHCRREFLGYEFKAVLLPGKKRKSTTKLLRSTRDLTVRQFAEYVEKITAWAATDLGITLSDAA